MKHFKYLYPLLSITSILFSSCGSDDSGNSIRYIESEIEHYAIYVGSETGGKELPVDSIEGRFNLIFPSHIFETLNSTSFTFVDDNSVVIEQTEGNPEINNYIFNDGSLYLYNDESLTYFGDGNTEELKIRQHYIAYKQSGDKDFYRLQAIPQKTINEDDIALQSPFTTIENMKSTEDTLVWCTKSTLFK